MYQVQFLYCISEVGYYFCVGLCFIHWLQRDLSPYSGSNIDVAHHDGRAAAATHEVLVLEEAVKAAIHLVNTRDTLMIVTADHSHTMSIAGYPSRGNPIFGIYAITLKVIVLLCSLTHDSLTYYQTGSLSRMMTETTAARSVYLSKVHSVTLYTVNCNCFISTF